MVRNHDDVAARWVQRALNGQQFAPAHKSNNLFDEGDAIYSYGHHFEVARVLRDDKRNPRAFLFNGDRFSVTTARHQSAVRSAIQRTGLPFVTIPATALTAAGIDLDSVELVNVQADWNETTEIVKHQTPGKWETERSYEPGGWQNTRTGEFFQRIGYGYGESKPRQETCEVCATPIPYNFRLVYGTPEYEAQREREKEREIHVRLSHGEWVDVPGRYVPNGRMRLMHSRNIEWELVDDPDAPNGIAYVREVSRHWLGASLIRAAVPYSIQVTHKECNGTGIGEARWHYDGNEGYGPLTKAGMERWQSYSDHVMERNGGIRQPTPFQVETYKRYDECRGCRGTGKVPKTRRRWAYFLSGFDSNETRPSYFFCELPPKVTPTTVEEAYEALKPGAVKLAESMGREVKRQGDIFAIPMPGLTLAELKAQGGVHRKRVTETVERTVWGRRSSRQVRVVETEFRAMLLGVNHEATEAVDLPNGQTYARGSMTHEPGSGRERDHKRLVLGKDWHLIVKNTVPVGV